MSKEPFDGIDPGEVKIKPAPKKTGKDKFSRPVGEVSRRETQAATGRNKGMHGQYKQANFKLRPEVVDEIEEWADRLRVNKSQLKRYIAWLGLRALEAGERPEFAPDSGQRNLREY